VADVLGTFEQAVMLTVLRLGDGAYGRAILKAVQRNGLLSSWLGMGTPVRAGRARRFYVWKLPAFARSMMRVRRSTRSGAA
jgi:hypothetical protein